MLATYGGYWAEWEAQERVNFDGVSRVILVHPHVTELDIRRDVWSAAVRWLATLGRGNDRFLEPMDRTGLDPVPGGETGDSYFLQNGWKLVIDFSKVKVSGVLFSRDFDTAYYTSELNPQYAAQVSSVVNLVKVPVLPGEPDVDAPVWNNVEGIANAYQNGTTINISWGKANDANPVSYNVYMSRFTNDLFASTSLLTTQDGYFYTLTGMDNEKFADNTTYYVGVRAIDIYGNETDNSNYATVVYDAPATVTVNAQDVWEYADRTLTAGSGLDEGQLHTALDSYTNKAYWKASSVDLQPVLDALAGLNDVSVLDIETSTVLAKEATLDGVVASIAAIPTTDSVADLTPVLTAVSNLNDVTAVEVRAAFNEVDFQDKNTELEVHTWLDSYASKDNWKADLAGLDGKLDTAITEIAEVENEVKQVLKDVTLGNWKIENNQMLMYSIDGTEIARFDLLDSNGNPTNTVVAERRLV